MSFVPAKCPHCGAIMRLDEKKEVVFCNACGRKILVEDAVHEYQQSADATTPLEEEKDEEPEVAAPKAAQAENVGDLINATLSEDNAQKKEEAEKEEPTDTPSIVAVPVTASSATAAPAPQADELVSPEEEEDAEEEEEEAEEDSKEEANSLTPAASKALVNNPSIKPHKSHAFMVVSILISSILGITLIVLCCLAFTQAKSLEPLSIAMLAIGGVLLICAFFIGKIIDYRVCLICGRDGTHREHHRQYLRTTNHVSNSSAGCRTTYKHYYLDTWICPKCGSMERRYVTKSGGSVFENSQTGSISDNRTDPIEF
jgi:DNA-directed RNA polymerase subunit RPC12/RpoP